FQQTGAYVYRLYRIAFGNNQPFPNPNSDPAHPGEEKKWPLYASFMKDRAQVRGGPQLSQMQFDLAKAFVGRSEFRAKYPYNFANPIPFIDALLNTINRDLGVNLSSQRTNLINLTVTGPEPGPAYVMYSLALDKATERLDNRALLDAEYNRAFVFTQYAGYLRRDADIAGLLFWLEQVDSAPLRDIARQHAMVCSFITSAEYQRRFSSTVTRNNTECPQ
ncbi:MAG TPA: DUF4214 domain-containing protein, partial [Pyrinomonadaceae bacterium]|nr:DUF4214 domain-containing protein [Pyrinomonadaceae bacterium]